MEMPFQDLWLPAVRARMVLFANHVLGGCAPALGKLAAHAGRTVKVDVSGWPGLIPAPPPLVLRFTPAGLLETLAPDEEASAPVDLHMRLDASAPKLILERVMGGALPPMAIEGDAAFAADVSWVVQNVRWDPAADAERFFGPIVAEGVSRASAQFAQAAEVARAAMGQVLDLLQSPSQASRKPK